MTLRRTATGVNVLWLASVLIVLSSYAFVFRNGEGRIAERRAEEVRNLARIAADERALAERPQLEAEQHRLQVATRQVDLGLDTTHLVARFVNDAARAAAQHHVSIVAIAAAGTAPSSADATVALDCTAEGRYADVLATLRALSSTRVLASVDLTSLARRNAGAADATISAALHVVLERLGSPTLPDAHARPV